jgi:hypothetical protein
VYPLVGYRLLGREAQAPMESDERAASDRRRGAARARSLLFTVRLWKQEVAGGSEYRGSVREVISGANRNFRDWSELASFMMAQVEGDECTQAGRTEGGT